MRRLYWILLLVLTLGLLTAPVHAQGGKLAPEFDYIPPNATLIVHSRIGDLWKSDSMKDIRRIVLKAGPAALATLDKRFSPAPSTADRVTAFAMLPAEGRGEPDLVAFCGFTQPLNKADVVKLIAPAAKLIPGRGKEWYGDELENVGLFFVDDRTFAISTYKLTAVVSQWKRDTPAKFPAELSDPKKLLVIAGNLNGVPKELKADLMRELPPRLHALLEAKSLVISLDDLPESQLYVRVGFDNKAAADNADEAIKAGIDMAKGFIGDARVELRKKLEGDGGPGTLQELPFAIGSVLGLGALQEAEDMLAQLPLKRDGDSFLINVVIPQQLKPLALSSGVMAGLLVPAVQKVRASAQRAKSQNNLKQIALAMHNSEAAYGHIQSAVVDPKGKALLSWRVHILPFIEQDNLYRQFKLDEPWDSENNKKLIPMMPAIYIHPAAPPKMGETHYQMIVGKETAWPTPATKLGFARIPDGTSNTWAVVEAGNPVIWTKPDDVNFDPKQPPKLANFFAGGFNVAYFDGSVRYFPKVPKGYYKFINPADGNVITPDDEK